MTTLGALTAVRLKEGELEPLIASITKMRPLLKHTLKPHRLINRWAQKLLKIPISTPGNVAIGKLTTLNATRWKMELPLRNLLRMH